MKEKKHILITGGSGMIGKELLKQLAAEGKHETAILSRSPEKQNGKAFYWNYKEGEIDAEAIKFADIIIHLAGENISRKRWTKKQKQHIKDSRVKSTQLLLDAIKKAGKKPDLIVSASAIGFYGSFNGEEILTEEDSAGNDFLAETVVEWEKTVDAFKTIAVPTIKLRLGVVLSSKGGLLKELRAIIQSGFSSALGNGKQYVPWIALEDAARMFLFVIEHGKQNEVYNAVAPQHITNYQLMKTLAKKSKKGFFMPKIPAFVLRLVFGEKSIILLKGSRISSEKIQKQGFEFKKPELEKIDYIG
jgi:uncharacterized protein